MLRKWIITCWLLCCASFVAADAYRPDEVPNVQLGNRERYVSNPDGILSDGAVARIDSICASMREKGLAQIAVVAVDAIEGDDAFTFAIELFRSWGVGDARNDNGLGILLVEELHEIRFVTGGGLGASSPMRSASGFRCSSWCPPFRRMITIAA